MQDTLTGVRPDIESVEETEDDTAESCSTGTRFGRWHRLLHLRRMKWCKREAAWVASPPCCDAVWYTCYTHLGNGHPYVCLDCDRLFKATDIPWRKIRR